MIDGRRVLAIVPARAGSKGVPGKNMRLVRGKPLIALTIEAAARSVFIDRLIVSTDDDGIASAASAAGAEVPFMRPAELATDEASSADVVAHAIQACPGFEFVVLLQPTSPLRRTDDIDGAIRLCHSSGAASCVTVTEAAESPYWMYLRTSDGRIAPLLKQGKNIGRRQELPPVYSLNGAVYVAQTAWFKAHRSFLIGDSVAYVMPRERSLDIDTEADFHMLNQLTGETINA